MCQTPFWLFDTEKLPFHSIPFVASPFGQGKKTEFSFVPGRKAWHGMPVILSSRMLDVEEASYESVT